MNLSQRLSCVPDILPPTLPLGRVKDIAFGIFLCERPLFLGSHWRQSRSYPCTTTLLEECRWCASSARRDHAYIAVALTSSVAPSRKTVLELPAATFVTTSFLYGQRFILRRSGKRQPVTIEISSRPDEAPAPPPLRDDMCIIRTLMKVYGLPDPKSYATEHEWLLEVQVRVNHPEYSPSKSQEKASQV